MKNFVIAGGGQLSGALRVASDKSVSHRAVLLSALAVGDSEVVNPLISDDVRATVAAVRACGATVVEESDRLRIRGYGKLKSPAAKINCGNAGTLMRLFCGLAAAANITCELVGDDSLMHRPMARVVNPLKEMGADIRASGGLPPIKIHAINGKLRGKTHQLTVASAQVKSALLLAGLSATGKTTVVEPAQSRDHTERMLKIFGATVDCLPQTTTLVGGQTLQAARVLTPADMSAAAFFMTAAAMTAGSEIVLTEVGINPTRFGVVEILRRMGADVDLFNVDESGAEPVADIRICGGRLRGIEIERQMIPSAIDDLPALCIAAAAAHGNTVIRGAGELRIKESDRIAAVAAGLRTLGIANETTEDGIIVQGRGGEETIFSGGEVDSRGDHRIAMAFAMAGLCAKDDIIVHNCENVATSFPAFAELAARAGLRLSVEDKQE